MPHNKQIKKDALRAPIIQGVMLLGRWRFSTH